MTLENTLLTILSMTLILTICIPCGSALFLYLVWKLNIAIPFIPDQSKPKRIEFHHDTEVAPGLRSILVSTNQTRGMTEQQMQHILYDIQDVIQRHPLSLRDITTGIIKMGQLSDDGWRISRHINGFTYDQEPITRNQQP